MATRLVRLADLDEHRVAKDHSDPRGWEVLSSEGRRVGKVAELLVDPDALRARYLDVRVDEKELDMEPVDRHILLPVDRVRLRDGKKVEVDGLTRGDFRDYPVYNGLPLKDEDEGRLRRVFGDGGARAGDGGEDRAGRRPAREAEATDRVVRDPEAREREPLDRRTQARRGGEHPPGEHPPDERPPEQPRGEERSRTGESSTRLREGEEVRVRVRDGEIVIEKGGRSDD